MIDIPEFATRLSKGNDQAAFIGIGVPGAGKTSLLQPLAEEMGAFYVEPAEIRRRNINKGVPEEELRKRTNKTLYFLAKKEFSNHGSVIVNAVHSHPEARKSRIENMRRIGAQRVIALYCDVELETAYNRLAGSRISTEELISMHRELTNYPPSITEGFDQVFRINRTNLT